MRNLSKPKKREMAKVRKDTTTPTPKAKGRSKTSVDEVQTATPKRKTRSTNATKKSVSTESRNSGDSGINSPEVVQKRTSKRSKNENHNDLAISKVSQKSKTSISKTKEKTKAKKSNEFTWLHTLKNLAHLDRKNNPKFHRTESGVEVRFPVMLQMTRKHEIDYVTFPTTNDNVCGYVKLNPGQEKTQKRSTHRMKFFILVGNVELLTRDKVANYSCGTMFHIPKHFKYGLRNPTKETVYLRFQSIVAENQEEQEDR